MNETLEKQAGELSAGLRALDLNSTEVIKYNVLGVKIDATDYEKAVGRIIQAAKQRRPYGVSALAVHGVITGVQDDKHRHRLNALEMIVPDGQPVRWAMNLMYGAGLRDRVYGPTLMIKTCEAAAREGIPIFLFGGTDQLLSELERNLVRRFDTLLVAGRLPSKFRKISVDEKREILDEIKNSGAGIAFVGLGCPRQEVWTYEFKDHLNMPVLAVGAAFNFHAGLLAQAPPWMQDAGLEWLFRLIKEPTRLWHRYLVLNPYFLSLLFLQASGLRKFETGNTIAPTGEILYG
jgi:hypothetical protein